MDATPSDPEVLAELVGLAQDEDRQLLQFARRVAAEQYRGLYEAVRGHVPPGSHVLDWGPGNGHFSYFLLRAGYRVTAFGLDPPGAADWLFERGWEFSQGRADEPTRLPFGDGHFDAVSSIGVLEHVHQRGGRDVDSLAELVRVLRPGGIFVCCHLPNQGSWIEAIARRIGSAHHHDVRYRPAEVDALLRDAGLTPIVQRRYGFLPRNFWARIPRAIGDSRGVATLWNALDGGLERLMPFWTQNHLVVARRPEEVGPERVRP